MARFSLPKILLWGLVGFGLIQLIPYGRAHTNPPVQAEPNWDTPQTKAYFDQACADCHSNRTVWPWYSHIAPVSWLVQHDVDEGRSKLNVSEMGREENEIEEMAEQIREGKMPPRQYLPTHPEARLSPQQQAEFIQGLERTFGPMKSEDGEDETEGD